MKIFILINLLALTFAAHATEYICRANLVKFELKLNQDMTTLTVRDIQSGEYYYSGVVSEISKDERLTDLMFETNSRSFLQLRFKTKDLVEFPQKMFGFAKGRYGAGFVDASIQCFKKENRFAH